MATVMPRGSSSFRLPPWAKEFLERTAEERKETQTQVVVEAVACLRERQLAALMAEGYEEMAEANAEFAEGALHAMREVLPEE